MTPRRLLAAALAAAALGASPAAAQTMLDQEERLIQIHSLLLDLPPVGPPGAYRSGELALDLELIGIPVIDGTTGSKVQITASDRTRVFPRPRLSFGLPAPEGFRAFVGAAYIPPIQINGVSTNYGALEAGFAWTPGPLAVGLRGHVLYARSTSPVTDPNTRDTLVTTEGGADLSAGYRLDLGRISLTPYVGAGLVALQGDFTVTSDGVVLTSDYTGAMLNAGVRLAWRRWEAVGEVVGYPGRLVHPGFRFGYVWDLARRRPRRPPRRRRGRGRARGTRGVRRRPFTGCCRSRPAP